LGNYSFTEIDMKFYIRLLLARNLDSLISLAEEYVFHGDLEKIIEVTYSYRDLWDWNILNETLFEEYLWLSYPEYDVEYLARRYRYKIQVQIVLIEDILKKIRKIELLSRSDSLRRWIFIEALEYVKNILEISVLATSFEMEKAGYVNSITQARRKKITSDIEKKEKLAFWPKVIESSEEFSFCYNFIVKNHETKKKKLSQSDKKYMKKILKHIKDSARCELIETPDIKKKYLRASFLKTSILRKDYRKIFDSVCELYNLPQRTKITNAGSIYDGDDFLEIPRWESFKCMQLDRILKLLTHEIESHFINSYNSKILLWAFRGANNLPKEEWLAMFMERIFIWYTHENIDSIVEVFFAIMAWECLDGWDFESFMRIMWQEYNCKADYLTSIRRAKRNYSFDLPWVQHKDVVYFRGLSETTKYLTSGNAFSKLFLWKVWYHDIDNLYDIYQVSERKDELVFPIFISDLIYYYLTGKEKNPNFILDIPEYYLYLKKKYWFLDLESFHIVKHMYKEEKKIEKILKLIEKLVL